MSLSTIWNQPSPTPDLSPARLRNSVCVLIRQQASHCRLSPTRRKGMQSWALFLITNYLYSLVSVCHWTVDSVCHWRVDSVSRVVSPQHKTNKTSKAWTDLWSVLWGRVPTVGTRPPLSLALYWGTVKCRSTEMIVLCQALQSVDASSMIASRFFYANSRTSLFGVQCWKLGACLLFLSACATLCSAWHYFCSVNPRERKCGLCVSSPWCIVFWQSSKPGKSNSDTPRRPAFTFSTSARWVCSRSYEPVATGSTPVWSLVESPSFQSPERGCVFPVRGPVQAGHGTGLG